MDHLSHVLGVYESGRYLAAYRDGSRLGLWRRVEDPHVALLASRVFRQVGGVRRARLLVLQTWRRNRGLAEAKYWYAQEIDNAVCRLLAMDRLGEPDGSDPKLLQNWLLLRAASIAGVRDFAGAYEWWERARDVTDAPWLWTVRGLIEAERDDVPAALEAVEKARALERWYTPAIHLGISMLRRRGRNDEALALATEANRQLEAHGLSLQQHFLLWESGDYQGALACLEQAAARCPLMDRPHHDWLAFRFAHNAYLCGDLDRTRRLATAIGTESLGYLARQLDENPTGQRRLLAVPMVAQHHNTCGPASLVSVAQYWRVPVEHEELVEEICRDGTTAYSERKWATEQGWTARDFTMTWRATQQLIDAGMPFTFVTTYESSAHLQVAMGYDARLGTVLVRDPSSLSTVEVPWDEIEKGEAAYGPRAMVMVPAAEAPALARLELPDAELHDLLFELEAALDVHDRGRAVAALAPMKERAPDHILTLRAMRALAAYDADPIGPISWADAMLAKHPDDPRIHLAKLHAMEGIASIAERRETAERFARSKASGALLAELATLVATTPGGQWRATKLLWRALDRDPLVAARYGALANQLWQAPSERELATLLYRFSSCLAAGDEGSAWAYFLAARITEGPERALAFLRARCEERGDRFPAAAKTLADAYDLERRHADGLAVLDKAERAHGDDGTFLVSVADYLIGVGDFDRAKRLLGRAEGRVRRTTWLRSAAHLASTIGDDDTARSCWREAAEAEPLAMDAQRAMAHLLAQSDGPDAAADYLRALCEQFPHHIPLSQLLYAYLSDVDDAAAYEHLTAYSDRHPEDPWAHREIALALARDGDIDGALARLSRAHELGDDSDAYHSVTGSVHEAAGDGATAAAAYRTAIERSADAGYAIGALMNLAPSPKDKVEELEVVHRALRNSYSSGDGVMAYLKHAKEWLEPDVLTAKLDELVAARPFFFEGHLARVRHEAETGTEQQALALAEQMSARFPLLPGAWRTLAAMCEHVGDDEGRLAALRRALALNPSWGVAIRELALAYQDIGDTDRAIEELERACERQPLDAIHRGYLARLLWRKGDRAGAVAQIERALRTAPGYRWGWEQLASWSEDPQDAIRLARELASQRGAIPGIWIALAELMPHAPLSARVACLDEAIKREPGEIEAHDLKAELLARAGRYEEALEACRPQLWGDTPPTPLRGRAAAIRYASGERREAWAELLEVVRESPDYGWGINTLLEWARATPRRNVVETCRQITEAAPRSPTAQVALGEALQADKSFSEAELAYKRALDLAPRDRYALLSLVDLYLERERSEEAGPLLDLLDPSDLAVVVRRGRIAALDGDAERTNAALEKLLRIPELENDAIDELFGSFKRAPIRRAAHKLLDQWVDRADAGRHVGAAWFHHVGKTMFGVRLWRRLARMPAGSGAQIAAIQHYIEDLGKAGYSSALWLFRTFYRKLLRANVHTWGSVSFSLLRLQRWASARRWTADWRERVEAEPWMLWNASVAARATGDTYLAAEINRHALTLPDSRASHRHRLQLAVYEALVGEPDAARTLLAEAAGPEWRPPDRFAAGVTEVLLKWRGDEGAPGPRDRELIQMLEMHKQQLGGWSANRESHQVYKWILRTAARRRGGVSGFLWWLRVSASDLFF